MIDNIELREAVQHFYRGCPGLMVRSPTDLEERLRGLSENMRNRWTAALNEIGDLCNLFEPSDPLRIRSQRPGDAGFVAYRHGVLYAREDGLDIGFDAYVLEGLNRFIQEYDPQKNHLWVSEWKGRPVGSIAIVRAAAGLAQLRWFLVEPEFRGLGIGNALLEAALAFCRDKGYSQVYLWTLSHLHAARGLYERFGFTFTERKTHPIWGRVLTEERWDLRL